jgi:hypothetical protein
MWHFSVLQLDVMPLEQSLWHQHSLTVTAHLKNIINCQFFKSSCINAKKNLQAKPESF